MGTAFVQGVSYIGPCLISGCAVLNGVQDIRGALHQDEGAFCQEALYFREY